MTPTPPEGAPRPGERYRSWLGVHYLVLTVFWDVEEEEWFIAARVTGRPTAAFPEVWLLDVWMQEVRGEGEALVPRFARETI